MIPGLIRGLILDLVLPSQLVLYIYLHRPTGGAEHEGDKEYGP